ncbi:MAG: hypothetical protein KC729_12070, partial [Candidatus Eisenbacteria bacterium]|nr:hypothetical protein [Candidatus Eisenbacteria bacterium]
GWDRIRFSTSPSVGFSKVEGMTSGGAVTVSWLRGPGIQAQGRLDRSYWRGVYEGDAWIGFTAVPRAPAAMPRALRTRITGGGKEAGGGLFESFDRQSAWSLRGGYSRRPVPFGTDRPPVNALQASLLGLDHQSYVDREERFVGLELRPSRNWLVEGWLTDRRDRSIASALDPLWQTDPHTWSNPSIDEGRMHGSIARVGWTRADFGEPMRGAWLQGTAFGGALGGDREFYTLGAELHTSRTQPPFESIELEIAAAAAGGEVPRQMLPDLGGSSTLRGHPPRALVGATSFVTRVDFLSAIDPLRKTNIPGVRSLRLQPVLFADLGAVWGERGWTGVSALRLPRSEDWRSDFGIGIQRNVNYPGLLSRIRVDLAWRTDRAHDRMRASLALTR